MIQNPVSTGASNAFKETYSMTQIENVLKHTEEIISNFDEYAIQELLSGNEEDLDNILETILLETRDVLYSQRKRGPVKADTFDYLTRVTGALDEEFRTRSYNYFVMSCLPNFEMNLHNLEWGNLLLFYPKLGIEAARDHSKSYSFSFAYPIWKLYRYSRVPKILTTKENQLNKEGMIITNEHSLAKKFLGYIREEIQANPLLREKLYPENDEGWGKEEITCKNGAILQVKGAGSALRGRHPGWIVIDDFLDESSLYSKEQRDKSIDLFHSVIMNMITPGGQVIVVGTPFHENDLYADLKKRPGWRIFEYPALYPDGRVLWSLRYTFDDLMAKKLDIGSIRFSREILVRPVSSESSIFPYTILKNAFMGMDIYRLVPNIYSFPKKFAKIAIGCDFAISASVGADYSVFTVLGLDEFNNYWLLHQWRERGVHHGAQIAKLKQLNANFRPDVIFAEDNAFQQVMIQIAKDNGVNVIGHTTGINKYDLRTGLPALATLFEQGRIKFPRGDQHSIDVTDTICMEATGTTWTDKGKLENTQDHDDSLMSLWIAIKAFSYIHQKLSISLI